MLGAGEGPWAQGIPMEAMDSAWRISKETSPLVHGLSDQQPTKRAVAAASSTALPTEAGGSRKQAPEGGKDCSRERHERHKSREPSRLEAELLKRVEKLLEERAQREACRMEDFISSAIGRFGEAFSAQMEVLRRDVAQLQSRCGEGPLPPAGAAVAPSALGGGGPRGLSPAPEATVSPPPLRSLLDEQTKLAADAQISGLVARVNAMQRLLAEVVVQQELQHCATGKFACRAQDFSPAERQASLSALSAQELNAGERLRRLQRPPKAARSHPPPQGSGGRPTNATTTTRTPSSVPSARGDDRSSSVSSASGPVTGLVALVT